ncbi:helix-turn-helix domain-containing protein [Nonomuraea sp. NPDC003214]
MLDTLPADLASAYTGGRSIRDLAAAHGCSQKTVFDMLVEAGVVRRPDAGRSQPLPEDKRQQLVAAYRAGVAIAEIVAQFGVSDVTARRIAADAGLPRRRPASRRRLNYRRIRSMAARGKSPAAIAAAVGSSPAYIRALLNGRTATAHRSPAGDHRRVRSGPEPMRLDLEAMAARYAAGAPVRVVAREAGCSVALLYRRFRRAGVPLRGRVQPQPEAAARIVDAYAGGWSMLDICATWGVTKSTVARLVEEAGVGRRPSGKPRQADWEAIVRLIGEGNTARETAQEVGCSPRQVARVLGKHGYEWNGRAWVAPATPEGGGPH